MNISRKMMLIVATGILLVTIPGATLMYHLTKHRVLATESVSLAGETDMQVLSHMKELQQGIVGLEGLSRLMGESLARPPQPGEEAAFDLLVRRDPDLAWRSRSENFHGEREAGLFLPPAASMDPAQKRLHLRAKKLLDVYGAASTAISHFGNIWMLTPERTEIIYDVNYPDFVYLMTADTDYTQTPWMQLGAPSANPKRETRWTPPLYDPVSKTWMMSAVRPVDVNGRWVGTIGQDTQFMHLLSVLFQPSQRYPGEQHILLDAEGHYILAGPWQRELEQSEKSFKPDLHQEPDWARLLAAPLGPISRTLAEDAPIRGQHYMVVGIAMQPLGWHYFRLVPVDEIMAPHFLGETFFYTTLLLSLLVGLVIKFSIQHNIVGPLARLTAAAHAYGSGNRNARLHLSGHDEIAQTAQAFDNMADNIEQQQDELRIAATTFEVQEAVVIASRRGKMLRINHSFTRITGYSPDEVLGHPPVMLKSGRHDARFYQDMWEKLREDKFWAGEILFKHKNGTIFPIWLTLTDVTAPDGTLTNYVGAFSDITEFKKAELKLKESESRFRAIFEQAGVGVSVADPRSGRFIQVNGKYCQIVGYSPEELQSLDFRTLTHPDDLPFQDAKTAGLLAGEFSEYFIQKRFVRKDGAIVWVELTCNAMWKVGEEPTFTISVVEDITQRKQVEEKLERHREHLQELVDEQTSELRESEAEAREALAMLEHQKFALDHHAILAVTDVRGRIIYANDMFCKISGYSREELLGQDHKMLNSGYHPKGFFKEMYRTVTGGQVWHAEICNRAKDGHLYWVDTTIAPFMGEDGKPREYISIRTDITERKRAEAAAEAANQSKSEFLANMSHEIRTPMNGVVGMVDILQQTELSREQRRMVKTIRDSALSLLTILNDILDFSKIEAGKLIVESVPTHVREVAENVAQLLISTAAAKNVDLHVYVSPDIPDWIASDPVRLRQILFNLLGNAVKFTSTKGAHRGQVALRVECADHVACDRLYLRIKDNGIGMTQETVASLFQPFTQADASTTRHFGGTGLGLSITKRLVEMLQGRIDVHSTPGAGSEFIVEIPIDPAPPGHPLAASPDLSGVHVLAVTANPAYAEILPSYLQHAGAAVHLVADLASARRLLTEMPDAVLLLDPETARGHRTLAPTGTANGHRIVQLIHRRSSSSNAQDVTVPVGPLLYHDLIQGVAIAAGVLSPQDSTKDRRQQPRTPAPSAEEARAGDRLILLAEDNETNREVIQEQLRILGYASEVAKNGLEALERWRSGHYALLLTDCHMPEMDGFQLTAAIRAEEAPGSHLPIIAVTANAMQGEAERCLENGMDDYLSKPLRLDELGPMLTKWLPHAPAPAEEKTPDLGTEATPTDAVVWDATTLSRMMGGDAEMHRRLLDKFLTRTEETIAALQAAVAEEEPSLVADLAHKLKSSARTVGAMQLGERCQQLESVGRAGDMQRIHELAPQLDNDFAQVAALIDKG